MMDWKFFSLVGSWPSYFSCNFSYFNGTSIFYTGGAVSAGGGSSSSASSSAANVLPAGNICPSGKIGKMGMMSRSTARGDVLGSRTGTYGHGSIMRGGTAGIGKPSGSGEPVVAGYLRARRVDLEEVTKAGNEHYKKGLFAEALRFYSQAFDMCPGNATCRNNRAAALAGLGRLGEAVKRLFGSIQFMSRLTIGLLSCI